MAEGDLHRLLVSGLSTVLMDRHPGDWSILADTALSPLGRCTPPALGSVRPDFFAHERETRRVIIGEAKTAGDLDNDHTALQLNEYFNYLAYQPTGTLLMAVPFNAAGVAYRICRAAKKRVGSPPIPFEITGWLIGKSAKYEVWRG